MVNFGVFLPHEIFFKISLLQRDEFPKYIKDRITKGYTVESDIIISYLVFGLSVGIYRYFPQTIPNILNVRNVSFNVFFLNFKLYGNWQEYWPYGKEYHYHSCPNVLNE